MPSRCLLRARRAFAPATFGSGPRPPGAVATRRSSARWGCPRATRWSSRCCEKASRGRCCWRRATRRRTGRNSKLGGGEVAFDASSRDVYRSPPSTRRRNAGVTLLTMIFSASARRPLDDARTESVPRRSTNCRWPDVKREWREFAACGGPPSGVVRFAKAPSRTPRLGRSNALETLPEAEPSKSPRAGFIWGNQALYIVGLKLSNPVPSAEWNALPVGPDFATYFKRTTQAVQRCKKSAALVLAEIGPPSQVAGSIWQPSQPIFTAAIAAYARPSGNSAVVRPHVPRRGPRPTRKEPSRLSPDAAYAEQVPRLGAAVGQEICGHGRGLSRVRQHGVGGRARRRRGR